MCTATNTHTPTQVCVNIPTGANFIVQLFISRAVLHFTTFSSNCRRNPRDRKLCACVCVAVQSQEERRVKPPIRQTNDETQTVSGLISTLWISPDFCSEMFGSLRSFVSWLCFCFVLFFPLNFQLSSKVLVQTDQAG